MFKFNLNSLFCIKHQTTTKIIQFQKTKPRVASDAKLHM